MRKFKVGDKVRIGYHHDCWPHNGEIGTITWVHEHNYYPNRDESVVEKRQQGEITYANGEVFGCGNLGYVELITESEA